MNEEDKLFMSNITTMEVYLTYILAFQHDQSMLFIKLSILDNIAKRIPIFNKDLIAKIKILIINAMKKYQFGEAIDKVIFKMTEWVLENNPDQYLSASDCHHKLLLRFAVGDLMAHGIHVEE